MEQLSKIKLFVHKSLIEGCRNRSIGKILLTNLLVAVFTVSGFYLSLVLSSTPVTAEDRVLIERAISILDEKGYDREVFLLRNLTTFRSSENWLNSLTVKENVYATTNFPFGIITLYEDFYTKTQDDIERAMILLHEVKHLEGGNENAAYQYVWRNRQRIGWTLLSHGTTPTYITIDILTRENAPELFSCPANMFNDCTENLQVRHKLTQVIK